MVVVGKVRQVREVGRAGSVTKVWATLCLLLTNGCSANLSGNASASLGCETGTEGCACYGNWSCNYQLSCVDEVCVDRRRLAAEQSQALTKAALRAADPIVAASTEECMSCLEDDCVSPLSACYDERGCAALVGCLLPCSEPTGETYIDCASSCYAEAPLSAHAHATRLQMCAQSRCDNACGR